MDENGWWAVVVSFGAVFGVVLGVVLVIDFIYGLIEGVIKEKQRKVEEKQLLEEEKRQIQRHIGKQQLYREQMIVLGEQSIRLFESMPENLSSAEKYLDQAEVDFADGAFAPFWDSIENAAKTLGRFDEGVRHIKDNSSRYTELIRKYEDIPPQFPLARQSMPRSRR